MKARPIIMTGPSAPRIIDLLKEQTRRIAKLPFESTGWQATTYHRNPGDEPGVAVIRDARTGTKVPCPFGKVGDCLWVREAFAYSVKDPDSPNETYDEDHYDIVYRATSEARGRWVNYTADGTKSPMAPPWRPARYMPRWASRLLLELTRVRAQRVQDILEEDAKAEGVELDNEPCDHTRCTCAEIGCLGQTYRSGFCALWEQIHGAGAWERNDWVWALTFKIVERARG